MTVNVVSFLFFDAQPEPWGPLCWVLAFFTATYQHLLWTPIQSGLLSAPSAGCGFPYHILSTSVSNSTATPLNWLVELIRAPSPFSLMWLSLPHLVYNSFRSSTQLARRTQLSYIIVRRPLDL